MVKRPPQGNTPLMYSCAGGHLECSEVLLEYGANPSVRSDADLDTPLHKAVRCMHTHTHTHTYMHICICVCVCIHLHIHTHTMDARLHVCTQGRMSV